MHRRLPPQLTSTLAPKLALALALAMQPAPPAAAQAPAAVQSRAQLEALLASGQPTPLDALTPHGKQRFLRRLQWGPAGLAGFGYAPLVRELDAGQLDALLRFLDLARYREVLLANLAGAPLRLPAPSATLADRLADLEALAGRAAPDDRPGASTPGATQLLLRYQASFADSMGAAALARQPPGDLLALFDAAALASQDNPGSPAFDQLLLVHAELGARGIDTRRQLDRSVLDAMLAARRFAQARAFAAARPHLDGGAIPLIADPLPAGFHGRSLYAFDAASNTLTRQAVPPRKESELLVVVGAGCGYSRAALEAIAADAALQARLQGAGLMLLTLPSEAPSLGFVADWNAAHPGLPLRIPAAAEGWEAIALPQVPAFYLLQDGKPVARHLGWAGAQDRAALTRLLDAAQRQGRAPD